jgi:hypothetical protein
MQIRQATFDRVEPPATCGAELAALAALDPHLVLVFAAVPFLAAPGFPELLAATFPRAVRAGCSTAGEITPDGVRDGSCVVTAVRFDRSSVRGAATPLATMEASQAAGRDLGAQLADPELRAVLVFGQGVRINGSALVRGLVETLGDAVPIAGGLAGDGGAFERTYTLGPGGASDREVVAVGLYGEHVSFGRASFGGWQPFGPARRVTRCEGNVLWELDGEPALDIYKRYLGEHAAGLPASGLLFPFLMLGGDHDELGLIRTILGVNEADGTLTLAGEIDPDGYLKLMHASTDKLVDGAETAAANVPAVADPAAPSLAVLVSCVGRKLVMGDRVDEEVEAVAAEFGASAVLTGFYSYGEIGASGATSECSLHNQTMTISRIAEA